MKTFDSIDDMRDWCREQTGGRRTIGLVPTMGALHAGHLSLVAESNSQTDVCVATIFVNPTQFAPTEDLDQYPRPLEDDLRMLRDAGVDAVFLPTPETMYPRGRDAAVTMVHPSDVALPLEGVHRPTHFVGVATVVMKLFQIVPADAAFFGQKDFQQLCVIEHMVRDLNSPVRIVSCPIVRETDGLAMSSRNRYLTSEQRQRSLCLSVALRNVKNAFCSGQTDLVALNAILQQPLQECDSLDYAVIVDRNTLLPLTELDRDAVALIAARFGSTRLIDNEILVLGES